MAFVLFCPFPVYYNIALQLYSSSNVSAVPYKSHSTGSKFKRQEERPVVPVLDLRTIVKLMVTLHCFARNNKNLINTFPLHIIAVFETGYVILIFKPE